MAFVLIKVVVLVRTFLVVRTLYRRWMTITYGLIKQYVLRSVVANVKTCGVILRNDVNKVLNSN